VFYALGDVRKETHERLVQSKSQKERKCTRANGGIQRKREKNSRTVIDARGVEENRGGVTLGKVARALLKEKGSNHGKRTKDTTST